MDVYSVAYHVMIHERINVEVDGWMTHREPDEKLTVVDHRIRVTDDGGEIEFVTLSNGLSMCRRYRYPALTKMSGRMLLTPEEEAEEGRQRTGVGQWTIGLCPDRTLLMELNDERG